MVRSKTEPPSAICRGDLWVVDLNPTRGREQSGRRPAVIVSVDLFNQGLADLVVVAPITTKAKGIPFHVRIDPPEGGVKKTSFIKTDDVRSISKQRLLKKWGTIGPQTIERVEHHLRILLGLS